MEFFVPAATPDNIEEVYASFAKMCYREVPPAARRVYSIRYIHDGEEWTATVGEKLRGTRTRTRQRGGRKFDVTNQLEDAAVVLAIFSGSPYMVVTNARPITGVVSHWENPFMAGKPEAVTYFSPPSNIAATDS